MPGSKVIQFLDQSSLYTEVLLYRKREVNQLSEKCFLAGLGLYKNVLNTLAINNINNNTIIPIYYCVHLLHGICPP